MGHKGIFRFGWVLGLGLVCLMGIMLWESSGFSAGRDPFAFPPGVQKATPGSKTEGTGLEKNGLPRAPVFRVTTILISGRNKVAVVNGFLVREGYELNGYRVAAIQEKQVVLERGKEKMVLHIDSGDKYFFKKTNHDRRLMGTSQ